MWVRGQDINSFNFRNSWVTIFSTLWGYALLWPSPQCPWMNRVIPMMGINYLLISRHVGIKQACGWVRDPEVLLESMHKLCTNPVNQTPLNKFLSFTNALLWRIVTDTHRVSNQHGLPKSILVLALKILNPRRPSVLGKPR